MELTYNGPYHAAALPDGQVVLRGDSATVDDKLGESLKRQGWTATPAHLFNHNDDDESDGDGE